MSAPFFKPEQGEGREICHWVRYRHNSSRGRLAGLGEALALQLAAPGAGELEHPAFVSSFVGCQADTAITNARPLSGECNAEKQWVKALERAVAQKGFGVHLADRYVPI